MRRVPRGMAVLLPLACAAAASAQEVYINAGNIGQGVLRGHGAECFVITPAHVVKDVLDTVQVVGALRLTRKGEVQHKFEPDFAIVRLADKGFECDPWLPATNYEAMLNTQTAGYLSLREPDGTRTRIAVNFRGITENEIRILPTLPSDQIQESMSGAALLVNGALVGLLLSLDKTTSEGVVYQLDDVMRISEPYFRVAPRANARENANAFAANFESWFSCSLWYCLMFSLGDNTPKVKAMRFGETASQLDRSIEPKAGIPGRTGFQYFPVRPGTNKVYAQLSFADGTLSEVRTLDVQSPLQATQGIRLSPVNPRNAQAPVVFAAYTAGFPHLQVFPTVPSGAVGVRYSFDAGGFFDARPHQTVLPIYSINAPLTATGVRLSFPLENGSELGPFEYSFGNVAELTSETFRASLAAKLPEVIKCWRVSFGLPASHPDSSSMDYRRRMDSEKMTRRTLLSRGGLETYVGPAAIVCAPDEMTPGTIWAEAREIRFGTAAGQLTERRAVSELRPGARGAALWHVALPLNATGVYAQVIFGNGTSSREFRIPIGELNNR